MLKLAEKGDVMKATFEKIKKIARVLELISFAMAIFAILMIVCRVLFFFLLMFLKNNVEVEAGNVLVEALLDFFGVIKPKIELKDLALSQMPRMIEYIFSFLLSYQLENFFKDIRINDIIFYENADTYLKKAAIISLLNNPVYALCGLIVQKKLPEGIFEIQRVNGSKMLLLAIFFFFASLVFKYVYLAGNEDEENDEKQMKE